MYITKYGCVFLKLGESIYVAMDLIPILLGSLPLAHNAQHSLVFHEGSVPGGAGQHHVRAIFADSAILCNTFCHSLSFSRSLRQRKFFGSL